MILLLLLSLGGESAEDILRRMRIAQDRIETLKAEVEQVKSYPQLGIQDPVERGVLYFERKKLRLEIREPEVRILVVKGQRYFLYQPRIRQAISGKLEGGGAKGLFAGILTGSKESRKELETGYTASLRETNGPAHLVSFEAKPGAAVYCQGVDIEVDQTLFLPIRQVCREANGSEIVLSLFHIETNASLDEGAFEIEVPAGTEWIRQGRDE
jgi:outer membrane lipoprotein-sorting protein